MERGFYLISRFVLIVSFMLLACSKNEDGHEKYEELYLSTSLDNVSAPMLPYSGGQLKVSIKSNCSWNIDRNQISMSLREHGSANVNVDDYISLSAYSGYGNSELYVNVGSVNFQYDVNYYIYIKYGDDLERERAISIWQSSNPNGAGDEEDEPATLPAPEISVNVENSYIKVFWDSIIGAAEYMVYRSSNSSSGYSLLGVVSDTYIIDSNPLKGYNYYKVKATDGKTTSEYSNVVSGYVSEVYAKPETPTDLRAVQNGTKIDVSWSASEGASYYRVYYVRPAPYDIESFENAYSTSMTFSWNKMIDGVYTFWVVAVNDNYDASDASNKVYCNFKSEGGSSEPKKLDTPTNLQAYSDYDYVQISFDEVPLAYEYALYRSKSAKGTYTKISASGGSTASGRYVLTDSRPLSGTSYYKVKAIPLSYLDVEESDLSDYISVTR